MIKFYFWGYLFVFLLLSFFSYIFVDPGLLYLKQLYTGLATTYRLQTTITYVIFLVLLFSFYAGMLSKSSSMIVNKKILIGIIFLGIFSYPAMLSFDIFNYAATAKVAYFYHENPYIIMPIEFSGDPLLLFTHAPNKIALYGPLWIIITGIPYILSFHSFIVEILLLKMVIAAFFLGTLFLIWKLKHSWYSIVFFAFNPLVVIDTLQSGHNDIVMMFFAICSLYLLKRKKFIFAFLALLSSILIKYATIVLVPIFFYVVIKNLLNKEISWNRVYIFCLIAMSIVFLYSPLREEIYPWYALWIISFISLITEKKILVFLSFMFCFGLLLRYIPFMLIGTYFGIAIKMKLLSTLVPVSLGFLYVIIKKKIWLKELFHM